MQTPTCRATRALCLGCTPKTCSAPRYRYFIIDLLLFYVFIRTVYIYEYILFIETGRLLHAGIRGLCAWRACQKHVRRDSAGAYFISIFVDLL